MGSVHPMVVHFPVALLLTGALAEVAGLVWRRPQVQRFAFGALVLGTIGSIGAFLSGRAAGETLLRLPGIHEALEAHENLAAVTMFTWMGLVAFRSLLMVRGWLNSALFAVYAVLCVAGGVLVGMTAYRGGELVYRHGAGVQTVQVELPAVKHRDNKIYDCEEDD